MARVFHLIISERIKAGTGAGQQLGKDVSPGGTRSEEVELYRQRLGSCTPVGFRRDSGATPCLPAIRR